MANSNKYVGNSFTDKLYNTIYTGLLENCSPKDTVNLMSNVKNKLESPQKEQFISLFVKLKMKNESLDPNSVLQICHELLEENEPAESVVRPDRINIIGPSELNLEELREEETSRDETGSSIDVYGKRIDDRITVSSNRITILSEDTRTQFGQKMLLNLTQCSQGVECIKMDAHHACKVIPNLEFMIIHVTELGRLHNVIKDYVNLHNKHCGRVADAFKFALQKEINSYYVYINMWLRDNFHVLGQTGDSLHKFIPLDYNVLIRFRYLAEVVNNAKGKNGCNLISALVNSSIRDIENTIINEIANSIQSMIVHWMANGEVEDKYEEFFIVKTSSENYWENSHTISSTNTLDFLNKHLLHDIYQTGKNMSFLLKVIGPKINVEIEKLRDEIKRLANEDGFLIMLADRYSKISTKVSDICAQSSISLMNMLINKYNLFEHFEGFRNYMLLGRGDFYAYVISQLERFFGNNDMAYYQLKDIMENAYDLTSAGNDDKKLFDNLKYKIETNGEVVNWDSFKFEYVTDEPLNQIFGPCFNHYTNVFEFLWRLKNVDWITNKIWQELTYFSKKSYKIIELKPILRNVNALLSSMLSCISTVQNFISEMINDEWERFKIDTYEAICVKTVTDAHMSVLESITKYVDDESVSLDAYVKSLKNNVEKFGDIFRHFVDTLISIQESSKSKGPYNKYGEYINTFFDDYIDIKRSYEKELYDFLLKLAVCKTRGLGTLPLRIDFNGYYSSKANCIYRDAPCIAVE